jgi:hypothetical protein
MPFQPEIARQPAYPVKLIAKEIPDKADKKNYPACYHYIFTCLVHTLDNYKHQSHLNCQPKTAKLTQLPVSFTSIPDSFCNFPA